MARGLDHLVLASRDLDAQAELYRRLGFTVGARNRHPWGTLNHIVQFEGHFLELIGLEVGFRPPHDSEPVAHFARFLSAYLARREGFAMLVLDSCDAAADQRGFERQGIAAPSTLFFERRGKRADGSDVHVAFTLAFARTPAITDAGFFVCQQHFPDAFWSPALQVHENTVRRVDAAIMTAADPQLVRSFLDAFAGSPPATPIDGGLRFETARGGIEVITPDLWRAMLGPDAPADAAGAHDAPRFVGLRLRVREPSAVRALANQSAVPFRKRGPTTIVDAGTAHGATLLFEAD